MKFSGGAFTLELWNQCELGAERLGYEVCASEGSIGKSNGLIRWLPGCFAGEGPK